VPPAPAAAPMTSPRPSEPRTPALYHAAPHGAGAAWLAGAAVAAIWLVQIVLGALGAPPDLAVGASFVAAIAVTIGGARRLGVALGVRRAAARFWVAGALVGGASWYLRIRLVIWLEVPGDTKALDVLVADSSLVAALGAVAILPAIAEELVFRGIVARALARRSFALAVVGSAALFALYHVLPIQMIAVFPFGLALAYIALRADSIGPAILAHALNNAAVIAISRGAAPRLSQALDDHSGAALAAAAGLVLAGLALATKGGAA